MIHGEQLKRLEEALKRQMKNLQRNCAVYAEQQNGEAYMRLVESLAWTETTRMEVVALRQLAGIYEVPFDLTNEGVFVVEDSPKPNAISA